MLTAVGRFLFGLLLGIIVGAGGVWWLMSSGAADFMLKSSHYVQDLERRVEEISMQRTQLTRQLETLEDRLGKMATSYEALERRFRELAAHEQGSGGAPQEPQAKPPAAERAPGGDDGL